MRWPFSPKNSKNTSHVAVTNIPKTMDDVRLEQSVDRLLCAHDHFTRILREFTEDVKMDNLGRRKTDV